jgi:hypothetical protein
VFAILSTSSRGGDIGGVQPVATQVRDFPDRHLNPDNDRLRNKYTTSDIDEPKKHLCAQLANKREFANALDECPDACSI